MQKLKGKSLKGSMLCSITTIPMLLMQVVLMLMGGFNPTTGDNWNENFVDIIDKTV